MCPILTRTFSPLMCRRYYMLTRKTVSCSPRHSTEKLFTTFYISPPVVCCVGTEAAVVGHVTGGASLQSHERRAAAGGRADRLSRSRTLPNVNTPAKGPCSTATRNGHSAAARRGHSTTARSGHSAAATSGHSAAARNVHSATTGNGYSATAGNVHTIGGYSGSAIAEL